MIECIVCLFCLILAGLAPTFNGSAGIKEIGKGRLLFEYFLDIGGVTVITDLASNGKWPDSADLFKL